MEFSSEFTDYTQTGYFSKLVTDYIAGNQQLQPLYEHPVSIEGIKAAIEERKRFATDRKLLVAELQKQYAGVEIPPYVKNNIESLLEQNTFTICTAHQPNIFTGHLYFIYKILHAIKLAATLQKQFPENNFVPVYYMGSEDADLEELGHVYINGEKHQWKTNQVGAVGRMKVDKALIKILEAISGQLTVLPSGNEIFGLMRSCYEEGITIEQATFKLVNGLFAEYGLVILLPDNASLKQAFAPIVEKELMERFSHKAVEETMAIFPAEYKVQPNGRDVNMFYLEGDKRERIEMTDNDLAGTGWSVVNTELKFTKETILAELRSHPERFSPNVVLRPVLQEFILPNIAFVGGGGEIAYWLQLKKVFKSLQLPYPVLVVRNSFMVIPKNDGQIMEKLHLKSLDIFKNTLDIMNSLVKRESIVRLNLEREKEQVTALYGQLKALAAQVDFTLQAHTEALQTQALKKINTLEKKMLSAERKKMDTQQRQLQKLKRDLFPNNNLQERIENIMPLYAKWGKVFIESVYENSLSLEQQFTILKEK